MTKPKRPRDANQLVKHIVDISTGKKKDVDPSHEKNPAAVELGRLGGLIGGKARAASLSAERRKEIARKAAETRWSNKGREDD